MNPISRLTKIKLSSSMNEEEKKCFISKNNNLRCIYCNCIVDHKRLSSINKHLNTDMHISNMNSFMKEKSSTVSSVKKTNIKNRIIESNVNYIRFEKLIELFLEECIPINKFKKPQFRMKLKNIFEMNNNNNISCYNTIQKRIIPQLYDERLQYVKMSLEKCPIAVLCDSSTSDAGSNYLSIIVRRLNSFNLNEPFYLINLKRMENQKSNNFLSIIQDTLEEWNIKRKQFKSFHTDNCNTMRNAGNNYESIFSDGIYCGCFMHMINLVAEKLKDGFINTKSFINLINSSFRFFRKKNDLWLSFLKINNIPSSSFFSYVETRWISWYKSLRYILKHFKYLKSFYEYLETLDMLSEKDKEILNILQNNQLSSSLQIEMSILLKSGIMFEEILKLLSNDNFQCCNVSSLIDEIEEELKNSKDNIIMIVNEICEENNLSNVHSSFIQEYKKSFTNTLLKLKEIKTMNKKQMIFYNEVKYFNPFLMSSSFPSFTSSEFTNIEKKDYLLCVSKMKDFIDIEKK
ncbi:hypothetical protein WA158_003945 [Blastocystis sp. Blastoise]